MEGVLAWGSEAMVQAYLNPKPSAAAGCGFHTSDHDCLCDIEVTDPAPARYTPAFLIGVETVEQLIAAAAEMWMQYDLLPRRERNRSLSSKDMAQHTMGHRNIDEACERGPELREALLAGKTTPWIREEFGLPESMVAMCREALGLSSPPPRPLPKEQVLELAAQGMNTTEISHKLKRDTGVVYSTSAVGMVLKRARV